MIKIQFLTMVGCHNCELAKKIFEEILPDFPEAEFKEIDMMTEKGQELVQKYGVMASPGIVINGELFSTGGVDREKLVEKLKSLQK
jgi:glutaredoxin